MDVLRVVERRPRAYYSPEIPSCTSYMAAIALNANSTQTEDMREKERTIQLTAHPLLS